MTAYDVLLFVHISALAGAIAAAGIIDLAMRRARSARSCGDALQWLGLGKHAARAFPIAMLTLVATGAYMVHHSWSWNAGFVEAGIVGIVFLGVVGDRVEGGRARRAAGALLEDPTAAVGPRQAALLSDPVWWAAATVNPAVAMGVAFDMVTKPSRLVAFAVLVVAALAGAAVSVLRRRAGEPVVQSQTA
jgi:hypothetical protein